ncbi:flippase [Silvibacterium dinghuense]|uniref:Flippase n=1 Tax=Silvibacterium dinghuense TaxID=1560006 RepID=A0A4Q1SDL4_9BACT|nr:flippase [Silvibacterium dinghuense]RXS95326.1 flippase [Silvibacterium dinghuense]GGH12419.1 peptide-binding protein [Silvibacterium dinghuense]
MKLLQAELQKLKKSTLARNAGWMFLGQGLGLISQALYFILLARLLGTAQYGVYAGTFALVSLVGQYSSLGSDTVFLRYVSADKTRFAPYWGNVLLFVCGLSLVVSFVLHLIGHYILNPESAAIVFPAAISICFCTQMGFAAGRVFQTFEKMRVTAMMNLLTNVMRLIAAAVMVVTMHRATAGQWVIASLIVSLIGAVVAVVAVSMNFGRPKFDFSLAKRHAGEGLQYSFSQSTSSAYNDLDKTMLSHYGMNVANGIYAMAYRVVEIATIPIFSLRDAAMPRFFQQGAKGIDHAAELGRTLLRKAFWLGLAGAAGMFLLAPLVPYVVGHDYAQSVSALRWLCLIPVFRSVHQMTGSALTGSGMQKYRTTSQCVAAAFNFCLNLWLIPRHGWLGAAWASLLTDGGLGIMNWVIVARLSRTATRQAVAAAA